MTQPNILFILIDDMGWKDLSCYGSSFYETPNIDKIAEEGISFTDAYASCPVCSPTRASIMTGKYPATVGITNFIAGQERGKVTCPPYLHYLPLEEKTIASALRDSGYKTYHVGKWHLSGNWHDGSGSALGSPEYWPEHHGFDINVGGCSWGMPAKGYFSPYGIPTLEDGPDGEYLTDRLTDEAIKLVENNGDEPFFMYMSHYAVHTPIQVREEWAEKYKKKAVEMGLDKVKVLEEGEHFPCEHKKNERIVRRVIQSDPYYAAMVENLDWNTGRLLKALDDEGKADNTIVVFTSDNGGLSTAERSPTSNAPLAEGKGWMYEGGTREPLMIRWPGIIEPGRVCTEPTTSPDFYPTFLEAAGLDPMPEQHCDGASIMPLLKGNTSFERGAIFWHYPHYGDQGGTPGCSVRRGDYKLIEFFEDGNIELYDLRNDIAEEHDLADEKPELAAELKSLLAEWRESVGAKIPEPNPDYVPWER